MFQFTIWTVVHFDLANKLGFEHDVICFGIQCESNGKLSSKNRLFWSWLSLCVKEVEAFEICVYSMHFVSKQQEMC